MELGQGMLAIRDSMIEDELERASLRAASCLISLSRRAERILIGERREIQSWVRRRRTPAPIPPNMVADLKACELALKKIRRISRHPVPHARKQVDRLGRLLDGGEFREFIFSYDSLVGRASPRRIHRRERLVPAFDICLMPMSGAHFPLVIYPTGEMEHPPTFLRFAGHGMCWGEAEPLVETALEEVDIHSLFLIGFTWGLHNL